MKKFKSKFSLIFVFLIVLLVLAKVFSGVFVDYLWFLDLGYKELFLTPIWANIGLGLAMFLLFFISFMISAIIVAKIILKSGISSISYGGRVIDIKSFVGKNYDPKVGYKVSIPSKILWILSSIIGFFSIILTSAFMENNFAIDFLKFVNSSNFNIKDIIFDKDISFYIFKLPFINQAFSMILVAIGTVLFVSLTVFFVSGIVNVGSVITGKSNFINNQAQKFLVAILGIGFIVYAIKKYYSIYAVIYSRAGYVFGAGNTDVNITIPAAKVLAVSSLIIGILCIVFLIKKDYKAIITSIVIYFIASFGVGIITFSYQNFYVSNNEFVAEKPYIENEIKYTRLAYGIDNVKQIDYPGNVDLTMENINNNEVTMDNIRLNDPNALSKVLSQNQGLRYYYTFGGIDIDRYTLDGKYRQVMIAPREINEESFKGKVETFINQVMRYTHGYGVAATLANDFDANGYAKLIVKDVPPTSSTKGIGVNEPRIYFGEMTNDSKYGYVIANTSAKEFDYPQGDTNIENVYKGSTGIEMNGINKVALSLYNNTLRYYLASEINSDSKLLMKRNINERVNKLMPYLTYDSDPYIVVDSKGKLFWMMDAYTNSDKFPYSMPYNNSTNYIRNSVKVVIDAYNGEVEFYVFEDEPIINTLRKIFPNTFKDDSQMPSDLKSHIRYPEGLFKVQVEVLRDFHVENSSVFYNKEDTWEIAKKAEGKETSSVEPYYTIMKLSGEKNEEFILMNPFTPLSRDEQQRNNLVAWLGARCDGENYGQLVLYKMPKSIEIQGPLMIDSMIDQDPEISSKMTLWGQGGSSVIRGNLLAVPIDDGFIYVEPIYIEADREGSSIPQLQAIVIAVDKKVVMVETNDLDEAIAKFFGSQAPVIKEAIPNAPVAPIEGVKVQELDKQEIINKLRDLRDQLETLEKDLLKTE